MSIVVCVMDRNGYNNNTDIIVIVDSEKKSIYWIPRDLYSPRIKRKINAAYCKVGPNGLKNCLKDLNIYVKECVCLLPLFIEQAIKIINKIIVPVEENEKYYYPLHRHKPIEKGKK